jgi:hypothetical protein
MAKITRRGWRTGERPWPLWHHVADLGLLTERKKALFAVAACRRVRDLLRDPRSLRGLESCEANADGAVDFDAFCAANAGAVAAARELEQGGAPGEEQLAARAAGWLSPDDTKLGRAATFASEAVGFRAASRAGLIPADLPVEDALAYWEHPTFTAAAGAEESAQADLGRELFGNPFELVTLADGWLTPTVVALADLVYRTQDYSPLPVLADALQDAGCDAELLLAHCRDPHAAHVRGCWAVDLVLGKG